MSVTYNGTLIDNLIVNDTNITTPKTYYTQSELDSIANAVSSKGSTPTTNTPTDIVNAVGNIAVKDYYQSDLGAIATAITNKGVSTSANASPSTMATNIGKLKTTTYSNYYFVKSGVLQFDTSTIKRAGFATNPPTNENSWSSAGYTYFGTPGISGTYTSNLTANYPYSFQYLENGRYPSENFGYYNSGYMLRVKILFDKNIYSRIHLEFLGEPTKDVNGTGYLTVFLQCNGVNLKILDSAAFTMVSYNNEISGNTTRIIDADISSISNNFSENDIYIIFGTSMQSYSLPSNFRLAMKDGYFYNP